MSDLGREHVADSTVAMACYNALALQGGPRSAKGVREFLLNSLKYPLSMDRVERGMRGLRRLGLIVRLSDGSYLQRGPRGSAGLIKTRERRKGRGWRNWRLADGTLLREALK